MKSSVLASYAILKVNWEQPERKDYLDNFVLIVAEAIRHLPEDIIALSDLQSQIRNRFGLEIPQNTINSLLKRVKKQGYIHVKNGTYTRDTKRLEKLNFNQIQQRVIQSYESLIEGIIEFVSENYDTNWTPEDANGALEDCLQENQIKLLNELRERKPERKSISQIAEPTPQYLISKYIEYLQLSQSSKLDFLETVVKGNMLANSIFLTEPSTYQRRFKNTTVFIDTPLAIFALGHTGEPRKWPITELINLLKNYGAQLKIFRHSLDEIVGILSACAEVIRRGQFKDSYGPSIEYFIERGFTETDVMMFIENLVADLSGLGIAVVDKPPYDEYEGVINEEAFCEYLQKRLSYSKERPLERDKDSITAILRLRRGQTYISIEECQALFVTSNLDLAYSARDYPDFNFQAGTAPLVVTDYELTNLVWLKDPSLSPNLPRRRLIADAYASIQPSDTLWEMYLRTIEHLEKNGKISSDQYFVLRHSIQAKSELMEKTRGDERIFTEGTVEEILKSVEERLRADDIAKLNAEARAKQEALQAYEREREARVRLEEEGRRKEQERLGKVRQRAAKIAKRITKMITLLLFLLLCYLTYAISSIGPLDIDPSNTIPKALKIIGLIVFWILLILQIISITMEVRFKMLLDRLEPKLANIIEKFFNPE